jgi:hypothetical protein
VRGVRRCFDELARAAADVVSDRAGRPRGGKPQHVLQILEQ